MDRERVSLSLKATQEDPWRHFARTHAIGQIVPGKVTKLVPFGAFVRVEEGIEGLVHISELSERHVEVPDQVVQVGDDAMVKVIDIDLERRRISLSLKQANEDYTEEFDPSKYGMADSYDEQGNYIFPEGFDSETNEWLEGFEKQRDEWESRYAEAERRHKMHTAQMEKFAAAEAEEAAQAGVVQRRDAVRGAFGGRVAGQRRPVGGPAGEARRQRLARVPRGQSEATGKRSDRMLRIGLTGGIGAGKSTVSATFSECGGIIVDGDVIAREVVEPGTEGLTALVDAFGEDILLPDGALNRPALAAKAFVDDEKRANAERHRPPAGRQAARGDHRGGVRGCRGGGGHSAARRNWDGADVSARGGCPRRRRDQGQAADQARDGARPTPGRGSPHRPRGAAPRDCRCAA